MHHFFLHLKIKETNDHNIFVYVLLSNNGTTKENNTQWKLRIPRGLDKMGYNIFDFSHLGYHVGDPKLSLTKWGATYLSQGRT